VFIAWSSPLDLQHARDDMETHDEGEVGHFVLKSIGQQRETHTCSVKTILATRTLNTNNVWASLLPVNQPLSSFFEALDDFNAVLSTQVV